LKKIIAELDRIAQFIEDFEEPWAINLVWRLDKISQTLEEKGSVESKYASISKSVLSQYKDKLLFLSENECKLTELIKSTNTKNATAIYNALKNDFGKLDKKDSIDYIKNVLKKKNE